MDGAQHCSVPAGVPVPEIARAAAAQKIPSAPHACGSARSDAQRARGRRSGTQRAAPKRRNHDAMTAAGWRSSLRARPQHL